MSRQTSTLVAVLLLTVGLAGTARANVYLRNFHNAHAMAAQVTQRAANLGNHHQPEFHLYQRDINSSDERTRRAGLRRYCRYLKDLSDGLGESVHAHANAIHQGDTFVRYYGDAPEAPQVRRVLGDLRGAKDRISGHRDAIDREFKAYNCHLVR